MLSGCWNFPVKDISEENPTCYVTLILGKKLSLCETQCLFPPVWLSLVLFSFSLLLAVSYLTKVLWREWPTKPQLNLLSVSATSHFWKCFPGMEQPVLSDTAWEKSPAASLNWWFDHPSGNTHLQLPLLLTVFERKIQFPRQICSVVTLRVVLTSLRGEGMQGRGETPSKAVAWAAL